MSYVFTEMQSERQSTTWSSESKKRLITYRYYWVLRYTCLHYGITSTCCVYVSVNSSMGVCTSVYRKMFTSHACSLCIPTFLVASNSLDSLPDPYTCGPSTFSKLLNVSHHHKNKGSTSTTPTPQKRAHTILNEVLGILTISQRGSADNRQKNADRQPSQPIH